MKRALACVLFGALLGTAQAQDASPAVTPAQPRAALEVLPRHLGYAIDRPDVLIRQRLFGLAHGLSLLAAACLDLPQHSEPIQDAYANWHARQGKTIAAMAEDLARYYFGPRAQEAQWQDLTRALNLNEDIQPALGAVSLQDACASLPAAISRPRYELDRLLAEVTTPVVVAAPAAAVSLPATAIASPAPAPGRPTE